VEIGLGQFRLKLPVVATALDELLVVLQRGFQELLKQWLEPRRFQERALTDLDEVVVHGATGHLGAGFRPLPLLFGPRTCLAQENQARR
jgi:hypothetical protein